MGCLAPLAGVENQWMTPFDTRRGGPSAAGGDDFTTAAAAAAVESACVVAAPVCGAAPTALLTASWSVTPGGDRSCGLEVPAAGDGDVKSTSPLRTDTWDEGVTVHDCCAAVAVSWASCCSASWTRRCSCDTPDRSRRSSCSRRVTWLHATTHNTRRWRHRRRRCEWTLCKQARAWGCKQVAYLAKAADLARSWTNSDSLSARRLVKLRMVESCACCRDKGACTPHTPRHA